MSEQNEREDRTGAIRHHDITVLLIDDQAMIGEAVRRMLAPESDIRFHFCQDPLQAIKVAEDINPTVILQDLVMPGMDGLTLVRFFRANAKTRDIPLIVLSSKEEPKIKAEAFSLGANDYLVKLPDRVELIARIRYHSRGYIGLLQRNEAMKHLYAELSEAAQYVRSLLPPPSTVPPIIADWRFVTSTSLGGDSFGYHKLGDDCYAIYLLDVCGHGVGAALLSVSVMNVLRSQTLPNTDFTQPGQVLGALNDNFQMEKQNEMFFTIWYGVYHPAERRLAFASGGHPPALFIPDDPSAKTLHLETPSPIIGAMPDLQYSQKTIQIPGPGRLYVFSDGVYEVTRPEDGQIWPLEDFADFMSSLPITESRMDRLLQQAKAYEGTEILPDDFSIVEIQMP
ncbi:MAG TPA: response regulator [Verrucomicrobia bacterium]|nr:response regulator [Verrucomicrobiota bacterium]